MEQSKMQLRLYCRHVKAMNKAFTYRCKGDILKLMRMPQRGGNETAKR